MIKFLVLLVLFSVIVGANGEPLYIFICGSSTYDCDLPDGNSSGGGVGVSDIGDVSSASGLVDIVEIKLEDADGSAISIPALDYMIYPGSGIPPPAAPNGSVIPASIKYTKTFWPGYAEFSTFCGLFDSYITYLNHNWAPANSAALVSCNESLKSAAFDATDTSNGAVTHYVNETLSGAYSEVTVPVSCPPGYSLFNNNTACVCGDPRACVDDNKQDVQRVGNAYSFIGTDLFGTIEGIQGTTNALNDSLSFVSANSFGEPTSLTVVANANGSTTITQSTSKVDGGGTSFVHVSTLDIDSTGNIAGSSGANYSGSLNTGVSNAAGGASTTAAPSGSLAPAPASGDVTFPSDYARSGEAAAAMGTVNSAVTATSTVADPVEPLVGEMPGWGNTFDNLTGWSLPAHVSVCPQPQMDLSMVLGAGSVYAMTSHCDLMNDNGAVLRAAMMAVWSIMAVFIVLRA